MTEEIIRVEDLLYTVKKRWKMITCITLVSAVASGAGSFLLIAPKYKASTKFFIGKENSTSEEHSYDNNDVQMYQKLMKTYAEVINTNDLVENAVENSSISLKSEEILKNLTVTPRADTQILELDFVSCDKEEAAKVVELISDEFIDSSKELIANGNIKVIESVKVPEKAFSPNKKMNVVVAFILGLAFSIGLSFVLEFMDNTFKTKDKMEQVLDLPVIGVIPDELNFE